MKMSNAKLPYGILSSLRKRNPIILLKKKKKFVLNPTPQIAVWFWWCAGMYFLLYPLPLKGAISMKLWKGCHKTSSKHRYKLFFFGTSFSQFHALRLIQKIGINLINVIIFFTDKTVKLRGHISYRTPHIPQKTSQIPCLVWCEAKAFVF